MDAGTYEQLQAQAQQWVSKLSGEQVNDFAEDLKSGVVLCKAINGIRPNTITKINTYRAAFRQMENIDNFLKVCEKLGVAEENRFQTEDLFYGNNVAKVTLTIFALCSAINDSSLDSSNIDGIREYAVATQVGNQKRSDNAPTLSLFEVGMQKSQQQASAATRMGDRIIQKNEKSVDHSGELGFIDSRSSQSQKMISGAKLSGTDNIIKSRDKAVASSELGLLESNASHSQAMISDAKKRATDNIIMSRESAVASSELGMIDTASQKSQKMISEAKGRQSDHIIRSKDVAAVSSELGMIDAQSSQHQKMISEAKNPAMDKILRNPKAQPNIEDFDNPQEEQEEQQQLQEEQEDDVEYEN